MKKTTPRGEAAQGEEWRAIPGYEGLYSVSSEGRVRSEARVIMRSNGAPQAIRERVRRLLIGPCGYPELVLARNGVLVTRRVHALVLAAFRGPRPPGCEASHLNGIRTDVRLDNLAWETPVENAARKVSHGTTNRGERSATAKMTERDVRDARARHAAGESYTALAREYGVSVSAMRDAVQGINWSHIQ
jgi:hypothetical protein